MRLFFDGSSWKQGCGGYADNFCGAVSCTGHGESILKVTLARLILSHIEQGKMSRFNNANLI